MIKIHLFVPADRLFFEKGSDFMKLEKLSDTQIRCTLSKEDLDDAFDYHYHIKNVDLIFKRVGIL